MIRSYLNASYSFFTYAVAHSAGAMISPPPPPAVSIELSTLCNLACPGCHTGTGLLTRRRGLMDTGLAGLIAEELKPFTRSAWLYYQGEPFMHPALFEIVRLYRGMNTVISTNGHFLDEENCRKVVTSGLTRIIISFDGITQDAYGRYRRNGDLATVMEGVVRLAEARRRSRSSVTIEIQFLLGRHNEHQEDDVRSFAKSEGLMFRVKSMQVPEGMTKEDWMPRNSRRSRYRNEMGVLVPARSSPSGCLRMWTSCVITLDGDIIPCCYDKNADHKMGNIREESLGKIWQGERYRAFRTMVMRERSSVEMCRTCPQGTRIFFR